MLPTLLNYFSSSIMVLTFLFLLLSEHFLIFFFSFFSFFHVVVSFPFLFSFLFFSISSLSRSPFQYIFTLHRFLSIPSKIDFFLFPSMFRRRPHFFYDIDVFSSCKIIFLRITNLFATPNYLFAV